MKNQLKTAALLGLLAGLFLLIGGLIGGRQGLIIALVFAVGFNFVSYWWSAKISLAIYKAKEADRNQYGDLYSMVEEIAHSAKLPIPKIYIVKSPQANAFACLLGKSFGLTRYKSEKPIVFIALATEPIFPG